MSNTIRWQTLTKPVHNGKSGRFQMKTGIRLHTFSRDRRRVLRDSLEKIFQRTACLLSVRKGSRASQLYIKHRLIPVLAGWQVCPIVDTFGFRAGVLNTFCHLV